MRIIFFILCLFFITQTLNIYSMDSTIKNITILKIQTPIEELDTGVLKLENSILKLNNNLTKINKNINNHSN